MIVADETLAFKVFKESVNELLPKSSILLFGSRARHDQTDISDYDLMIITKDFHDIKQVRLFKSIIRKKLFTTIYQPTSLYKAKQKLNQIRKLQVILCEKF